MIFYKITALGIPNIHLGADISKVRGLNVYGNVFLTRHGASVANKRGIVTGGGEEHATARLELDDLSPDGVVDAAQMAAKICTYISRNKPQEIYVYSSALVRSRKTRDEIEKEIQNTIATLNENVPPGEEYNPACKYDSDKLLNEINFGQNEGSTAKSFIWSVVKSKFRLSTPLSFAIQGNTQQSFKDGESFEDVLTRVQTFLRKAGLLDYKPANHNRLTIITAHHVVENAYLTLTARPTTGDEGYLSDEPEGIEIRRPEEVKSNHAPLFSKSKDRINWLKSVPLPQAYLVHELSPLTK